MVRIELSGAGLFTATAANRSGLFAAAARTGFFKMALLLEVGCNTFLVHFLLQNPDCLVEFRIDNSHVDQTYHLASIA